MARFARVSLLLVGVGLLLGTVAYAGVPDPVNSQIQLYFSDTRIVDPVVHIVNVPVNQTTGPRCELKITVKDASSALVPNAAVFVVFSKAATDTLCWCNTQLQTTAVLGDGRRYFLANADANGVAKFQISAGGCFTGTSCVQIKAAGAGGVDPDAAILLHTYGVISSMDNAGAGGAICDGSVGTSDLVNYATAQLGGVPAYTTCSDYDASGDVGTADLVLYASQHLRGPNCAHTGPKW